MRIRRGTDINDALHAKGYDYDTDHKGQNTYEFREDRGGTGKIDWHDDDTFSEPMSAFMTGVLRVFGIITGLTLIVAALWGWYQLTM